MAHRERLLRFYQKYNADKLHEIDGVLERFKGKEASLFTALVKKYGPEPSADEDLSAPAAAAAPASAQKANASGGSDKKNGKKKKNDKQAASAAAAASAPESNVVKDFNHARLLAFYNRYNPEKVDDVPNVLIKYKGKEAQLFNALVKKYGPEPGDSDDEGDDDDDDDDDDEEDEEEEEEAKPAAEEEHDDDEDEDEEKTNDDDDDDASSAPKFKTVVYCPVDTFPPEYCEYGPLFNDCKPWLAENCPTLWLTKYNRTMEDFLEAERQIAAGVEGITLEAEGKDKTVKRKGKKKQEEFKSKANALVYISKSSRKGRKRLTFVTGLEDFDGVNIKDASKSLGKRFACSASLSKTDTGKQQIQLQGDCITELMEVLPEMFGISEDRIRVVEEPTKGKNGDFAGTIRRAQLVVFTVERKASHVTIIVNFVAHDCLQGVVDRSTEVDYAVVQTLEYKLLLEHGIHTARRGATLQLSEPPEDAIAARQSPHPPSRLLVSAAASSASVTLGVAPEGSVLSVTTEREQDSNEQARGGDAAVAGASVGVPDAPAVGGIAAAQESHEENEEEEEKEEDYILCNY